MPMESGKWRLYVYSEVDLDQEKIQKLGGEYLLQVCFRQC